MHVDAISVLCAQLTRDLLAIAKFLLTILVYTFLFTKMVAHKNKIQLFHTKQNGHIQFGNKNLAIAN